MKTILGAGLAGLSCSYHLGHENCIIFEKNSYCGGHIHSHRGGGFVWDEGPHVSFTKNHYVRDLFEKSVESQVLEFEVQVANYYQGSWIPHPAQSNLHAFPEPLRTECLNDFLDVRSNGEFGEDSASEDYSEWLNYAFGRTFAENFPASYTRKYWTCEPNELATDWLGKRVFFPDVETVVSGYKEAAQESTHYITTVRYPVEGGYDRFCASLESGAHVEKDHCIDSIDLKNCVISFTNGLKHDYDELINTLPLPEFIRLAGSGVPLDVRNAAESLRCSALLLVNVTANHAALKPYHWLYVYDDDKYSTRINHIEMLSPSNAPQGKTGIQVEVYESQYKPFNISHAEIAQAVIGELKEMGLIESAESVHTQYIQYANVIFDKKRRDAQNVILSWLEQFGLVREGDDLDPMTDWQTAAPVNRGKLSLAGRFGQWKYFWTDDCVLRGKQLGKS
mgnify:CR=1 FL=1